MIMSDKFKYMILAIKQAALSGEDIPVGCVIEKDGEIISVSSNKREKNKDISAHAEIVALKEASKILGDWRLRGCKLYVTLEPCPMCA